MDSSERSNYNRRQFLRTAGSAAALSMPRAKGAARDVSIILSPDDAVASSTPVKWAAGELRDALAVRRITATVREGISQAAAGDVCVLASGGESPAALEILASVKTAL